MKYVGKAALLAALCVLLSACGGNTVLLRAVSQEQAREPAQRAAQCAALTLPESLHAPMTDGALHTAFEGDTLAGAFTSVHSCRTNDFCAPGAVTVCMQASAEGGASAPDAACALWRQTGGGEQYLETVVFACDGAPQTHTFTGLQAGERYRLVFSYTGSAAQRMTGAFTVGGVTAQFPDDEPGAAIAVDAPPPEPEEEEGERSE